MWNIILLGMPGVGKTTIGRILARKLAAKFVDTDTLVIEKTQMSIPEIFEEFGEKGFREAEAEVIKGLTDTTNAVIATGGGAVLDGENLKILLSLGKTVALYASPKTLRQRLAGQSKRPLLGTASVGDDGETELSTLKDLLAVRLPYYQKAQYQIQTERLQPEEVADLILERLKS